MDTVQVNEELFAGAEYFVGEERQRELREFFKFDQRRVILGNGALATLGEECRRLGAERVLLVHDPGVPGLAEKVRKALEGGGIEVVGVFDGIAPNPGVANVAACARAIGEAGCEAVVALPPFPIILALFPFLPALNIMPATSSISSEDSSRKHSSRPLIYS